MQCRLDVPSPPSNANIHADNTVQYKLQTAEEPMVGCDRVSFSDMRAQTAIASWASEHFGSEDG
ncbi:hypothetical protein PG993_007237 [Apiospora rasikravindrae]|uniref:DUF397 domain-containing protein n=1 Tax=Apiospora rasikravindrae TaxID=990691 RepID=A0ABR1SYB8_9PEZI